MTEAAIHSHPTHARYKLLGLIFLLAVITYMDRLCISAAMLKMGVEFNLTPTQKGYIYGAFTLAYALFEIPGGWLGDRFGARLALTRIVLWWSAFTMLTGAAAGFGSLLVIRFLSGAGEAGAFPNIARAVSRWFPAVEQGRALSASFIGLATGSAMTAPIVLTLVEHQNWRWTFVEFGLVGALWCVAWHRWFRDLPEDHRGVNAAELNLIRSEQVRADELKLVHRVPWRGLFNTSTLPLIGLMYFAYAYGLYFYITWLPTYLRDARGFSLTSTKWLAALPWVVAGFGFALGGWMTDRLARRGKLKLARCGIGAAGYLASAIVLAFVARVENNLAAALLLALALGFQSLTISAAWAVCLDVGRRHAGVITGFMNGVGNIGGTVSPIVIGKVLAARPGAWAAPFYVMAAVFVVGAVMWLLIDPRRSVVEEPAS
jgi:MFS family permease